VEWRKVNLNEARTTSAEAGIAQHGYTKRSRRPKLLFLVTEDWAFWSHRLPLARAARDAGFDVVVATRVKDHAARIIGEGLKLVPIQLSRRSMNPVRELAFLWQLFGIYRDEQPDIVHHVTVKPVLYGSLIARLLGVPGTVNALTGMGYVFASPRARARLLRPFVVRAYRLAINGKGSRLIVQNPDDAALLRTLGIVDSATHLALIRGSGVEMERYLAVPEPTGIPLVILPSRMLWDKGVGEFVQAAKLLRARGVTARFALVGESDPDNPAAITPGQLCAWKQEGDVEWWGFRTDMPAVLASAHVVCLPSYYGEGVPKALIEAACCARPLIAADVPGSREIVRHNDNGLLVPPRDVAALADALERLIADPALRARMGTRGRERVGLEFSVERVVDETLRVYRGLVDA
jgi:glycosyltransferase involved in cell wall biosynthesis